MPNCRVKVAVDWLAEDRLNAASAPHVDAARTSRNGIIWRKLYQSTRIVGRFESDEQAAQVYVSVRVVISFLHNPNDESRLPCAPSCVSAPITCNTGPSWAGILSVISRASSEYWALMVNSRCAGLDPTYEGDKVVASTATLAAGAVLRRGHHVRNRARA